MKEIANKLALYAESERENHGRGRRFIITSEGYNEFYKLMLRLPSLGFDPP